MSSEQFFLSYSRTDSAFALKLTKDLRKSGISVWFDKLDIPAGSLWDQEIEKALKSTNCMLVILSAASVASHNVMDEVSYAMEEGKKVVPVLLNDCEIPFRLRRLQRIDFSKDYKAALVLLLNTLQLNVESSSERVVTSLKKSETIKVSYRPFIIPRWAYLLTILFVTVVIVGYLTNNWFRNKSVVSAPLKPTDTSYVTYKLDKPQLQDSSNKQTIQKIPVSSNIESTEKKGSETNEVSKADINDLIVASTVETIDPSEGHIIYHVRVNNKSKRGTYSQIFVVNNQTSEATYIPSLAPGMHKDLRISVEDEGCKFWIRELPMPKYIR